MKKIKLLLLVFVLVAANLIIAPQIFAAVDWRIVSQYLAMGLMFTALLILARVLVTFGMSFGGAILVAILMWISASLVLVFAENDYVHKKRMEQYKSKSPPVSSRLDAPRGMNLT
jgi:hypothetical protein